MAASTSRQPHETPIPSSATNEARTRKKKQSSDKGKGKGKQNISATEPQVTLDSWETLDSEADWEWSYLTDISASKVPPIFTKDGNYFFSLVGSSVKIHSVTTGQVVSTLSAPRSTGSLSSDFLTTAVLNPHNSFQLITGSLNGRLVIWDYVEAVQLQTIDISQPIHFICAHESWRDTVFVAASKPSKKPKAGIDENAVVLRVSLKPVDNTSKPSDILPIGKTRFPTGLALSPSGKWLVATAGHKVYVAATSSLSSGFIKYVSPERLACLSFHPTEEYFATGDDKGIIRLWYCLNEPQPVDARGVEKKAQTTALHWHAHAVSSISFTSNGAYLLSGGEECVLVIWQLQTGKKEFVPRVGAPISTVSVSKSSRGEEEFLLGLADASYIFVSSGNLMISRSHSRIKLDPPAPLAPTAKRIRIPLAVHTLSSTLILPSSHHSSLQIFSPSSSKLVSELEVSPSNRVSRRDDKSIEPSVVEYAAVSPSGQWLATIDSRYADDGSRDEIYLKIWSWDTKSGQWILNTRIDRAHGFHKITSLCFSPGEKPWLVATGEDGMVKTWGLRSIKKKAESMEEFWVARSTFGFRSEVPTSATWSQDGSILAVTFGPYVALYDPSTNVLCHTLVSSDGKAYKSAHFIGREGRYLVTVGECDVTLWDLVSQTVRWRYNALLSITHVVPHQTAESFAIFHTSSQPKTRVLIFRVGSSTPFVHHVPFKLRTVVPYLSSKSSVHTFVGITDDWNVALLGDDANQSKGEGSTAIGILSGSAPQKRTLFQDIFGKTAFEQLSTSINSVDGIQHAKPAATSAIDILASPAYLMPALENVYDRLIGELLRPRPEDLPPQASFDDDEDVDMDEEFVDSVIVGSRHQRIVNSGELDVLVSLFRNHSVKCASTSPAKGNPPKSKTSPSHQMSSVSAPRIGSVKKPTTSAQHSAAAEVKELASNTLINGRKRKKSLG